MTFRNDYFLYDELKIEDDLKMKLPEWVSNSTLKTLKESVQMKINLTILNPKLEFKQIFGGLLIGEIGKNFKYIRENNDKIMKKQVKKDKIDKKAKFYSTVINFIVKMIIFSTILQYYHYLIF